MSNVLASNPNIKRGAPDFLYHLGISTNEVDVKKLFHDVKFVVMGGSPSRMFQFAKYIGDRMGVSTGGEGGAPYNHAHKTDRYCLYKAGPVLCCNHGIGVPSLSVVINEVFKLLFYAECTDVIFLRVGTSGGVGIAPGTVVITDKVVNGEMKPFHSTTRLGRTIDRECPVDQDLVAELSTLCENEEYEVTVGTTLSVDSFYEAQCRTDGALCDYSDYEKLAFLTRLRDAGVRNLEMESVGFFSLCHRAGYRAAMLSVTLVNRLESDVPTDDDLTRKSWERRPFSLAHNFIRSTLNRRKPATTTENTV